MITPAKTVEMDLKRVIYRFKPLKEYRVDRRYSDSFVYYVSGGHLFHFGNGVMEVRMGQLLYIPYGCAYTNVTLSEDTEYYQIDFNLCRGGEAYPLFEKAMALPVEESAAYLPVMRAVYEQYALGDGSARYFCVGDIYKIIGMITKEKSNSDLKTRGMGRIEKTVSYLQEFYDLDTPVGELAEMSATCVSNLEKTFKSCLGMTPLAYRNKLRMERAAMLLSGGVSIANACRRVGIPDIYYFSRQFKKHWGISPGEYAKNNKTV